MPSVHHCLDRDNIAQLALGVRYFRRTAEYALNRGKEGDLVVAKAIKNESADWTPADEISGVSNAGLGVQVGGRMMVQRKQLRS